MKKFISIFSIFLFVCFAMNTTTIIAQPKTFSEGFYYPNDLSIMENVKATVQNVSKNNEAFIIIFDDKERIQQAARLESNSQKHILLPIKSNYEITIIGKGQLAFS